MVRSITHQNIPLLSGWFNDRSKNIGGRLLFPDKAEETFRKILKQIKVIRSFDCTVREIKEALSTLEDQADGLFNRFGLDPQKGYSILGELLQDDIITYWGLHAIYTHRLRGAYLTSTNAEKRAKYIDQIAQEVTALTGYDGYALDPDTLLALVDTIEYKLIDPVAGEEYIAGFSPLDQS